MVLASSAYVVTFHAWWYEVRAGGFVLFSCLKERAASYISCESSATCKSDYVYSSMFSLRVDVVEGNHKAVYVWRCDDNSRAFE